MEEYKHKKVGLFTSSDEAIEKDLGWISGNRSSK